MSNHSTSIPSTVLFRGVAIMVLFLTVTVCGLEVLGVLASDKTDAVKNVAPDNTAVAQHPDTVIPAITQFVPVVLTLIGGIAMSTLLEGISRLIHTHQHPANEAGSTGNLRLLTAVADLQSSLPSIIAQATADITSTSAMVEQPGAASLSPAIEAQLERMVKLLEEMKEVSMLDENQRQTRRKQLLARRKSSRLEEAARLINNQKWEEADALLHLMESLHPDDSDVRAIRGQLDDARISSQADGWEQLKRNVDEMLAGSRYQEALTATSAFLDRYPSHFDAQQLAVRIRSDAAAYSDSTSNRLYDEIKAAVEARQWRGALDAIQRFLDQFPDHSRAGKIRQQIRVIQKNAEIEERHELEEQIREAIAARQYAPAVEMCEDLLARFPDSQQAAYLTELLPKLRERATAETPSVGV